MMADPEFFKPENHPYTEHPTYTGPGCCICGKGRELHLTVREPKTERPDRKN